MVETTLKEKSPCSVQNGAIGYRPRGRVGVMGYAFDAGYVRRLIEGDPQIERHFVEYFGLLLHLKLRRKLGHTDEMLDVRQETFVRVLAALRRRSGLRDPARLGGFVNSVCDNVLHEYRRKVHRMPLQQKTGPEPAGNGMPADSELVRAETVEQVRKVLEELPEQDCAVLRSVFLEERNRNDICREYDIGRDYLRVILHRAKNKFRQRYNAALVREGRVQSME